MKLFGLQPRPVEFIFHCNRIFKRVAILVAELFTSLHDATKCDFLKNVQLYQSESNPELTLCEKDSFIKWPRVIYMPVRACRHIDGNEPRH